MAIDCIKTDFKCPYCGWKWTEGVYFSEMGSDYLIRCPVDEGGCDRQMVVSTIWSVKVTLKEIEGEYDRNAAEAAERKTNMSIDKKFKFLAVNPCKKGVTYTEADGMLLLAKDNACLPTLNFYLQECERIGADQLQLDGIKALIARVEAWRAENPEKCKVPDTDACEAEAQV